MKFTLKPVDSIPKYLDVYCGFNSHNHEHLPIIWRCTNRSSYSGWADWEKKYAMVNFYYLYHLFIDGDINIFVNEFLRIYYHEFIHLFFNFKSGKIYFKGKFRKLQQNETIIDRLAIELSDAEIVHVNNWAYEIFEDELNG